MEELFYTPTSEHFQKMRHKIFFRGFIRPKGTRLQGGNHFLATISTLDEDENTQNKCEF